MLDSLDDGAFCTDSCPKLRATMATARNLLRVPRLGLLAFCLFSRSSALRLLILCSEHTKETCIVLWLCAGCRNSLPLCFSEVFCFRICCQLSSEVLQDVQGGNELERFSPGTWEFAKKPMPKAKQEVQPLQLPPALLGESLQEHTTPSQYLQV